MSEQSIYQKIFDAIDLAILAETGVTLNWREAIELRGYIKSLEEAYVLEGNDYRAELEKRTAELHYANTACMEMKHELARLQAESGWIPVSIHPKESERYLCYDKEYGRMTYSWESESWWYDGICSRDEYVTHWMPLPEPPESEG